MGRRVGRSGPAHRAAAPAGNARLPPGPAEFAGSAWLASLRSADSRFEFTDPPFRQSLPLTLAFAASASRPTAVLTGPRHLAGGRTASEDRAANGCEMVCVRLDQAPLTATAALAWSGDLPRQLQQVLFDVADGINLHS